ncbi:34009_t:CDS:2, partial [Racocetra persica]
IVERHKLIPLVYAVLDVQEGKYGHADAVIYSGPTFIRICSGKHDSSTTYSREKDFDNLMNEGQLRNYTTTTNKQPKPVVVLLSDGVCFAPYQSVSNLVERRIAPLSHDLAGVILPHDTFGTHLDTQLRTNDEELEKCNFKAAGDVLTSESNLSVKPPLDIQDFQVDTNASIHNYRHDEVLVSNQSKDAMWVEKETVPED